MFMSTLQPSTGAIHPWSREEKVETITPTPDGIINLHVMPAGTNVVNLKMIIVRLTCEIKHMIPIRGGLDQNNAYREVRSSCNFLNPPSQAPLSKVYSTSPQIRAV